MSTNEIETDRSASSLRLASSLATAFIYLDALDRRTFSRVEPPLTPAQYHALAALQASPGQSLGELAGRLLCDKANASGLIDRLTALGLATRERDQLDGRRVVLTLTDTGAAALRTASTARRVALAHALGPVIGLEEDLGALVDALRAAVETSASSTNSAGEGDE